MKKPLIALCLFSVALLAINCKKESDPPVFTKIAISPDSSMIGMKKTQQFTATGKDQYGDDFILTEKILWSATGGTIDTSGLYKAGVKTGYFTVKAQSGLITDSIVISVVYGGIPFIDSVKAFVPLSFPGKMECEFYDKGGEGIAYHDSDPQNNGSGGLNTGPTYYDKFRKGEAPDISYTKFEGQDNSPYNMVTPLPSQLYLGWIEPGEWTKYSVDVAESGNYKIGVMYTSNRGGTIRLYVDDTIMTPVLNIPTTYNAADPFGWRQWHHWNRVDSLTTQYIEAGRRVMKLSIVTLGNFNFDYFLFTKVD
jgi:hypothetical protein